jgi:hypothetical protein
MTQLLLSLKEVAYAAALLVASLQLQLDASGWCCLGLMLTASFKCWTGDGAT